MKFYYITNYQPEKYTMYFLNGSAMLHFNKTNPLIRYFMNFDINIISLELPGHGSDNFNNVLSLEEYLSEFLTRFNEEVDLKNKKYGMIGFSLGGLLILKLFEKKMINPDLVLLFGTGVIINDYEQQRINNFTTPEFFDKMGWTRAMKKFHGIGWDTLLPTLANVLGQDILTSPDHFIKKNIRFIFGDKDQAFPPDINITMLKKYDIKTDIVRNCSHFDYFTKSWRNIKKLMDKYYLERFDGARA